jgi:hypothetical protein
MKTYLSRKQTALLACTAVVAVGSYVFGSPVDFLLDTLHGVKDAAGGMLIDPATPLAPLLAQAVVQSTYSERMAPGLPGQIASMNNYRIESRTIESTNGIPFGKGVSRGALDRGCVPGFGATGTFLGITCRDVTLSPEPVDSLYIDEYRYRALAGILTTGDIWVLNSVGAAVDGGQVFVTPILATVPGNIQGSNANAAVAIPNARWMTTTAASAVGIIRLGDSAYSS